MKKVILSALIVSSVLAISCKQAKEETKNAVEAAVEKTEGAVDKVSESVENAATKVAEKTEEVAGEVAKSVESALDGVSIPSFDNKEVEDHLKNYATYAKECIAAKGDALKSASIAKKGAELASKGAELIKNLDAESKEKFNSVMSAIQAKMSASK